MPTTDNTILVPIDFSEQSLIALGQSYNLARLTRADITLIHVIEISSLPSKGSASEKKKELVQLVKTVNKNLDALAKETSAKSGVHVKTAIENGKVYEEIDRYARKNKCKFIVMGTNGTEGGLKRFIGSNALRVVRETPCPVITIRGEKHRKGCKHILLPLDLQRETKEKVSRAIEFANYFGSTINILSVVTSDDEFIMNKLTRQIKQVEEYITKQDVPCTSALIEAKDVVNEVLTYSKKINADLIMIMTQGEMNWTKLFIGSAAQEIINRSEIPVLSINPSKKKNLIVAEY